jgi:thiamine transport system permease protein
LNHFNFEKKYFNYLQKIIAISAVVIFAVLSFMPLFFAIKRLQTVTGVSVFSAISTFFDRPANLESLSFTLVEASVSALATVLIGLPIAWHLARSEWKHVRLVRALLAVPFVTPAIVAAMGFLALISEGGLLWSMGIDLRLETGIIGVMAETFGWQHPGHFIALILAHAWFNLSLVIRFVEPPLATFDPRWEEQLSLLPGGNSRINRLRNLWIPFIGPAILCSAVMTFLFSFTSFALVKWLTPFSTTMESSMANMGGAAGIMGYRVDASMVILSTSAVQFLILMITLILLTMLQRRNNSRVSMISENVARNNRGKLSNIGKITIFSGLIFTLAPMISIFIASFRIRTSIGNGQFTERYSFDAWVAAWQGDLSYVSASEALSNSLIYAVVTLLVSLPLGWILSSTIHSLEKSNRMKLAKFVDVLSMLPLAISAVMVGLGILLGILRYNSSLFSFFLIPVLPHIMLTTPFVVRIMTPAMRAIDPVFEQQAKLLNLSPLQCWWHGRLSFLRGPAIVAASLTLAFSLGEFGASWILVRTGSWDTLSILVDQLMSRPKFDPMVQPVAMATASMLMILTFILFVIAERFRPKGDGGGI